MTLEEWKKYSGKARLLKTISDNEGRPLEKGRVGEVIRPLGRFVIVNFSGFGDMACLPAEIEAVLNEEN